MGIKITHSKNQITCDPLIDNFEEKSDLKRQPGSGESCDDNRDQFHNLQIRFTFTNFKLVFTFTHCKYVFTFTNHKGFQFWKRQIRIQCLKLQISFTNCKNVHFCHLSVVQTPTDKKILDDF